MSKFNLNLPKLRQSQKILSKEQLKKRPFKFCCCDGEEQQAQYHFMPSYQSPPPPKISIKIMRKRSQLAGHHSNSSISISKNSNRSNIVQKRGHQSKVVSYTNPTSDNNGSKTTLPTHNNITFLYSNGNPQNKNVNYRSMEYIRSQPYIPPATHLMYVKPKINHRMPPTNVPLNQSIEQEFKNILDIGDSFKQQYSYGEPFPLGNPQGMKVKSNAVTNMPNFSFGQNQKDQFMSKYLNVKQLAKQNVVQLIEQRQSKSSKSSEQVFIRGTFNKNSVNGLKRRDLLYEYKSQSELSLQSSQSLVIESYQNIMRRRESVIRDQY